MCSLVVVTGRQTRHFQLRAVRLLMLGGWRFCAISVATGRYFLLFSLFAAERIPFTRLGQTRILLRFPAGLRPRLEAWWDANAGKMSKGVEKWVDVG
jgi:hypothetical protein